MQRQTRRPADEQGRHFTGYGGRTREQAERHAASLRRIEDRSGVQYVVDAHPRSPSGFGVFRVES